MVFALLINFLPRSEVDRARETPTGVSANSVDWLQHTDLWGPCDRRVSARMIASMRLFVALAGVLSQPDHSGARS